MTPLLKLRELLGPKSRYSLQIRWLVIVVLLMVWVPEVIRYILVDTLDLPFDNFPAL
jgi:hypothetical protein